MLNRRPIFIVGLSRGGSSILLNILRSHPQACSPRGETNQVFYGKPDESLVTRAAKICHYLPILFQQREHVFSPHSTRPRRPLTAKSRELVDRVLYREKLLAKDVTQNRYKSEGVEYTPEELRDSRLLCKNLDGLAFTTPLFAELYPDATFFGLVRNGLASCEGHVRRGSTAKSYGALYARVCGRILDDAERLANFHLIRYDDLANDTLAVAEDVFGRAGLDGALVTKYRLIVGNEGDATRTGGTARQLRWYTPEAFARTIAPGIDAEQAKKLAPSDREAFLGEAGDVMRRLGYS